MPEDPGPPRVCVYLEVNPPEHDSLGIVGACCTRDGEPASPEDCEKCPFYEAAA